MVLGFMGPCQGNCWGGRGSGWPVDHCWGGRKKLGLGWDGGHSASRGGHFRQILIILEKFFNHLDDWFRSLFMCLKLSNTFKHIFPKDIAYTILESSKMTEKAEKNQNFQVFMFTYFLVTKMIMMFSICSKLKKNSFWTSLDTNMADFFLTFCTQKAQIGLKFRVLG